MRQHNYYVYMLTNWNNKVLYIGVTNDLERRLQEHQQELIEGFTKRYHVHKLVYYEWFARIEDAIACEKRLKGYRRERKNSLVEEKNPYWKDLAGDWPAAQNEHTTD